MTTFAHTETGQAIDPVEVGNQADYLALFTQAATAGWQVAEVPDGTMQNATFVNGTWINPIQVAHVPQPLVLNKQDFDKVCFGALGGIPLGIATFQAIMDSATTAGGAAKGLVTYFDSAMSFVLADIEGFFAILVGAGCCTQDQANAVIAAWPTA